MTPTARRRVGAALVALLVAALGAPQASARTDEPLGFSRPDRVGDVDNSAGRRLPPGEVDRVDLVHGRFSVVPGRRVHARLRVVDLGPGTHRALYGLSAEGAGRTGNLFAWATPSGVRMIDDEGTTRCRGSRSTFDRARDVIRFSVPVRCFPGPRFRLSPVALLESDSGRDLAFDQIPNRRWVSLR